VFNSVFSPGFVRESPVSVGLDRDAPYHRDGGIAVVLVASCELARRDPSHSNKTLTVHSNILALLGAKGNVKDLSFSRVTDRRLAPLFTRDPPPTTTNAPTGFVPFERQFENEPRDGRVVRVPEDDRTANQPGPPPGIPPAAPTLQELNFGALRHETAARSMTGLDRSAQRAKFSSFRLAAGFF
jgi:hypothetical protein